MKALDVDTIAALLGQEEKAKESHRTAQHGILYVHGFDKKMFYLLDLPYEQMFVPWESRFVSENPYHRCVACGAMVKNRESHFNWHKRELSKFV